MKKEGSVHPTPKTVQKNVGFNPSPTRYAHYCFRHWVKSHPDEKVGDRHGKLVTCCSWL